MAPSNNHPDREGSIPADHAAYPHFLGEQHNHTLWPFLHKRQDQSHKAAVRHQPRGFRPGISKKARDWNDRYGLHEVENMFRAEFHNSEIMIRAMNLHVQNLFKEQNGGSNIPYQKVEAKFPKGTAKFNCFGFHRDFRIHAKLHEDSMGETIRTIETISA